MSPNGQEEKIVFEMEYDLKSGGVRWRTNPKFPLDKLVHGLSLAHAIFQDVEKSQLLQAMQQAMQKGLVMADGSPAVH